MDFPASFSLTKLHRSNGAISNGIDASEIAFIDRGVEDYEFLARGVKPGVEVHLLDADAMAQMTTVLSEHTGLKVVHVVSHGSPGCLYLGEGELSLSTLGQYEAHLRSWFTGYTDGEKPDLLLYGCNVAGGDVGEEFLSQVANLTGMILHASRLRVGAFQAGGVWQLDYGQSQIQPIDLFSVETQQTYSAVFAPGDLDTSFGNGGKVTTDFNGGTDHGSSITIDAAGNILVGGSADNESTGSDFALARYTSDGQLDNSFGSSGKVTTDFNGGADRGSSITIDSAGNILVGGSVGEIISPDFGLARYTNAGQLDSSFGIDGKVTTDFNGGADCGCSITIDAVGNILVGGSANNQSTGRDFALARYTSDGQLDSSFGIGGKVTTDFSQVITDFNGGNEQGNSITIDAAGNILVGGTANLFDFGVDDDTDIALARYTSDGQLDTSFGNGGKVTTDFNEDYEEGHSITTDVVGNILVAGWASGDFALVRYSNDGQLDSSFGVDGKVVTNFNVLNNAKGYSITIDAAGNILVAGTSLNSDTFNDFALARYTSDGQLDTSFGNSGKVTVSISGSFDEGSSITIDAAGNIFVAGQAFSNTGSSYDFAIAKFDGSFKTTSISWNTKTGVVSSIQLDAVAATATINPTDRTITDTDWALQTLGDLDGNGQEDVLLRNATSGQNLAFYMNPGGQSIESEALIGRNVEDPNWSIVGTGDFNADGKTDIIWQNQAADQILAWYMDGQGSIESEAIAGRDIGDSDWKIEAVADFSSDGKADMLLRNGTSGQIILWEMDGDTIIEESLFGREVSDINWVIEGARDFDNNGTMDVLLRNAAADQTVLWSMADKTTIDSESMISNMPGADSQIVF